MIRRILMVGALAAVLGVLVKFALPEARRYLRMREM